MLRSILTTEMNTDTLVILTNQYPGYTPTERVFVENELPALLRKFKKIVFLPLDRVNSNPSFLYDLPSHCDVDWSLADDKIQHCPVMKFFGIFTPFTINTLLGMIGDAKNLSQWREGMLQAINAVSIARAIRKFAKRRNLSSSNSTFYSFWFHHAAHGLALASKRRNWNIAVRCHSFDIYDEVRFHPLRMRHRLIESISKVFSISRDGRNYLTTKHPDLSSKFDSAPLGSKRLFAPLEITDSNNLNDKNIPRVCRFVTVARIAPEKRHTLILALMCRLALMRPELLFDWLVIGDGPNRNELEKAIANTHIPNLDIRLTGTLDNREIQQMYSTNPPDWFIMLSNREGMPVSICEAMSYSIPVISTDVGAIAELVDDNCSILLPKEVNIEEAAWGILDFIDFPARARNAGRSGLARWEKLFNSENLAENFSSSLALPPSK